MAMDAPPDLVDESGASSSSSPPTPPTIEIREVWAENVEEEMAKIREIIADYPYVAMDTEFPGIVAKPIFNSSSSGGAGGGGGGHHQSNSNGGGAGDNNGDGTNQDGSNNNNGSGNTGASSNSKYSTVVDYQYKSLKVNVDLLKMIQLGLAFSDAKGNLCPTCACWQFNFKFDLAEDMFAQDSIDLLLKSGISFAEHATRGIDPLVFGELLMVSGLVLDERVRWVSFHSAYDYGYLLKILTTTDLPAEEKGFFDLLKLYFPTIYDIKYMTAVIEGPHHHFMGGLQRLADELACERCGMEHQAGSDSLLTMAVFFALLRSKFDPAFNKDGGNKEKNNGFDITPINDKKYKNELFGYGKNHTVRTYNPYHGGGHHKKNNYSAGSQVSAGGYVSSSDTL